jgi:hypothetical protein
VVVISATELDEELARLRPLDDAGTVMDKAVLPGLKTERAMSLRDGLLPLTPLFCSAVDGVRIERLGWGAKKPQPCALLDGGPLTVGVGAGVEDRNDVLNAKPIIMDINANLEIGMSIQNKIRIRKKRTKLRRS